MYYNIRLKLIENNKWCSSFIDTLAKDLKIEFPTLKGMSARNLRYMQKFATEFENDEFLQHDVAKLPWSSVTTIMVQVKGKEQRKWYIKESIQNGWARPVIIHQIASKLYERQSLIESKTTNIENEDYYIDLLFYNLKVRSYVVIELKTTEFKLEYAGKLNFYLSAVDKYIKDENDNPTFGILLCKDKKRVTAELALKDINKPIGVSEYKILSEMPEFLENTLPSIEDIEKKLEESE